MTRKFKPPYAESHSEGLSLAMANRRRGAHISDESGLSKVGKARVVAVDEDSSRKTHEGRMPQAGSKPLPKV